jgi:hypothetical protein
MFDELQKRVPNFIVSLSETIAWCSAQNPISEIHESDEIKEKQALGKSGAEMSQLRSPSLRPHNLEFRNNPAERVAVVNGVAEKRAIQLKAGHRYPLALIDNLSGGKLLLYSPDDNLSDGAAQCSSKGFFDVNNIPPWDTWICFFERYLVSWVPPRLLPLASAGIDVNPEQCILWTSQIGAPSA